MDKQKSLLVLIKGGHMMLVDCDRSGLKYYGGRGNNSISLG